MTDDTTAALNRIANALELQALHEVWKTALQDAWPAHHINRIGERIIQLTRYQEADRD